MSDTAHSIDWMSPEQYLLHEQTAPCKSEYVNGVLYAMAGTSDRHNLIAGDLFARLLAGTKPPCQVFFADIKVRVRREVQSNFYYPDIVVACTPGELDSYYRDFPVFICEVLSPSTERIDRTEKFDAYRSLPSLQEYLLVHQDLRRAEVFRRRTGWRQEVLKAGDTIALESLGIEVPLADVYARL